MYVPVNFKLTLNSKEPLFIVCPITAELFLTLNLIAESDEMAFRSLHSNIDLEKSNTLKAVLFKFNFPSSATSVVSLY